MSRKASERQEKMMQKMFRGTGVWKQLNTGFIDEHVKVVREYIANVFFYTKNGKTIMIDAGYNYPRLEEKMGWLGISPKDIDHILLTHIDTDHTGALEEDSEGLFRNAKVYLGAIENGYLTGEKKRKVYFGLYPLPKVIIPNEKVLLKDRQVFMIGDIKIECILMPGHTIGHMVYLIDDRYLFTGDTIWLGIDGGYSFLSTLAWSNKVAKKSLFRLEKLLRKRKLNPIIITGHTGWTDDTHFAFAKKDKICGIFTKRLPDPQAPYDGYDESDDTGENTGKGIPLAKKISLNTDRHDEIEKSYRLLGNIGSVYDGIVTYRTLPGKLMNKLMWGFNRETTEEWMNFAMSGIPENFKGKILEVPVGTGVLTMPLYKKCPKADIVCLDYSEAMMKNAGKRARAMRVQNVTFIQGDVGQLPFPDESFDIVLSLNGFHAFPDKEAAYRETYRVLKKGGIFCGCFYIKGKAKRTDWVTKHIFVPKGSFTPPFETEESLVKKLQSMYEEVSFHSVRAEGTFVCKK